MFTSSESQHWFASRMAVALFWWICVWLWFFNFCLSAKLILHISQLEEIRRNDNELYSVYKLDRFTYQYGFFPVCRNLCLFKQVLVLNLLLHSSHL